MPWTPLPASVDQFLGLAGRPAMPEHGGTAVPSSALDAPGLDPAPGPAHGKGYLAPGAEQIVPAISVLGELEDEPAFPLPAVDFDSIPPAPTHSIGENNLDELMDHLNRSGTKWDATDPDGGVTLQVAFPQEYDDIP